MGVPKFTAVKEFLPVYNYFILTCDSKTGEVRDIASVVGYKAARETMHNLNKPDDCTLVLYAPTEKREMDEVHDITDEVGCSWALVR